MVDKANNINAANFSFVVYMYSVNTINWSLDRKVYVRESTKSCL